MGAPKPCRDCVDIHGMDPGDWLSKWPEGAELMEVPGEGTFPLCDGCFDERIDSLHQASMDRFSERWVYWDL